MWMHYAIINDKTQQFYTGDGGFIAWTSDPWHALTFNYHADAQHVAKIERANGKNVTIVYVGLGKYVTTPDFQQLHEHIDRLSHKQGRACRDQG